MEGPHSLGLSWACRFLCSPGHIPKDSAAGARLTPCGLSKQISVEASAHEVCYGPGTWSLGGFPRDSDVPLVQCQRLWIRGWGGSETMSVVTLRKREMEAGYPGPQQSNEHPRGISPTSRGSRDAALGLSSAGPLLEPPQAAADTPPKMAPHSAPLGCHLTALAQSNNFVCIITLLNINELSSIHLLGPPLTWFYNFL